MEDKHRFFNIEQAGNFLKELKNKLVSKVKKTVSDEAKISTAFPKDRKAFLAYALTLLDTVSSENMNLFYKVTGKDIYSSTELAQLFKKLLTLRIAGYSLRQIGFVLKTPPDVLKKVEQIALMAVSEAIEKAQVGIPILNG